MNKKIRYTQDEVEKRIKYIEGAYYIDITEEGKRLFGEDIIGTALARLDMSWILRSYLREEYWQDDSWGVSEWCRDAARYDKIIKQEGAGKVFEYIVNEILAEKHKMQINVSDGIECLVIGFTNGKEMFISNSEWGEVSSEPGTV